MTWRKSRGRSFSSGYRFGFQGQEQDDEVKGTGNSVNYKYRVHDVRLGRFLSLDPLAPEYPWNSPYAFSENRVIDGVDLEGLEHYYAADGSYIGKVGKSSQVRVLDSDHVNDMTNDNFKSAVEHANSESESSWVAEDLLFYGSSGRQISFEKLNLKAYISTIKQTENGGNSALGYNSMNGFSKGKVKTFTDDSYESSPEDYVVHPGRPSGSSSSAAGAYQILEGTWKAYKKAYDGIDDFSPKHQDKIVLKIFEYAKALDDIYSGNFGEANVKLTNPEIGEQFSSLPGGSQTHITSEVFDELIRENTRSELNGSTNIATPDDELPE